MSARELVECIAHLAMTGRIQWPRRAPAAGARTPAARVPRRPHERAGGVFLDPREGREAILAAVAAAGIRKR